MFIKSFKIRTSTAIRGSDRRRLRSEVQRSFPNLQPDELASLVPNKDDMAVTKITTHSGEMVVFYSVIGEPIFFEVEKRIYPTVYTLWKHPEILKLNFTTWPTVLEKLANGADLMLPGLVLPTEGIASFECFERDELCIVTLKGNQAAAAVGLTTVSRKDLFEDGLRGKGVKILHVFSDCLWAHGSKTVLPQVDETIDEEEQDGEEAIIQEESSVSEERKTDLDKEDDTLLIDETVQMLTLEEPVQVSENVPESVSSTEKVDEEASDEIEQENNTEKPLATDNMDELLEYCFFCAVLRLKDHEFPVLTSAFFRNHMLAYCPAGKSLDVKKSSYKKLSKFLHSLQERGVIAIHELSKGVDSITAIDFAHEDLKSFKTSLESLPPKANISQVATEYQGPLIQEMVSVSGALAKFFADVGYGKGSIFSPTEVRKVVTEYIKKHELVHKSNPRMVILDPIITSAIVNRNEDVTSLTWDNLFTRILNKMNSCYQITLPGQSPIFRKGKVVLLEMRIEQRMGNKKVTLVRNLDTYGIDPQEFAHKMQLKAATSTSISQLPGKSAGMQVLVQGNQVSIVASALLDDYKIPKKYIGGLELLKSTKKKK